MRTGSADTRSSAVDRCKIGQLTCSRIPKLGLRVHIRSIQISVNAKGNEIIARPRRHERWSNSGKILPGTSRSHGLIGRDIGKLVYPADELPLVRRRGSGVVSETPLVARVGGRVDERELLPVHRCGGKRGAVRA